MSQQPPDSGRGTPRNDSDLVRTVAADLKWIEETWGDKIDDDSLRRGSGTLRSLLVDKGFGRAWRAVGFAGEPEIVAPDLESSLRGIDRDKVAFAQAGGAIFQGIRVALPAEVKYALTPQQVAAHYKMFGSEPPTAAFPLTRYLESLCMIYNGYRVRRREVIKYIANRLGGVHLGFDRDPQKDQVYITLDRAAGEIRICDKPAAYFELLSIGQALASSPDTRRFLDHTAQGSERAA